MATRRTKRMVERSLIVAAALVLIVLAGGLAFSTARVYTKMVEAQAERREAEKERDDLAQRNAELSAALQALETERGIEAEIRSRYPLVKEGEVEFVIVDEEKTVSTSSAAARSSFWDQVVEFFAF